MKTLTKFLSFLFPVAIGAAIGLALALHSPAPKAATPNVASTIAGVVLVPIHVSGQYTATTADVAQFKLPFAAKVLGVSAKNVGIKQFPSLER